MNSVIKEDDVIKFLLKCDGEATLDEISSALKIPKYGPNSAYAILYSLKTKNIVERRGNRWALIKREAAIQEKPKSTMTEAELNVEEAVEKLKKTLNEGNVTQEKPIEAATKKIEIESEIETTEAYFLKPNKLHESIKTLKSLQTGTFLDSIFLGFDGEHLGGIPISGQFAIAGPLGSGKSLLVDEIALKTAYSGLKALYIALDDVWKLESQMFDLQSRMRLKAEALNLNWDYIIENLYVLNPREIDEKFVRNYKRLVDGEKIDLIILDSINSFERLKKQGEMSEILDEIIESNRNHGVTGLFILHANLGRDEPWMWMRGSNYPLYAMDGVILMTPVQLRIPGLNMEIKGAERLRVVQVLRCRICCFDRRGILVNVTRNGLVRPIEMEPID